jgi:NAD(P)-dependent dehydrogenase (short-subunit alcohol dehydrogenase family)
MCPGIGLSLTKQCHDLGARILVADLKTTALYDEFSRSKSNIIFVQADVTVWSSFERMFAACEEEWNDVPDFYGICAGLFEPPFSNFWDDTEDEGYKQVEVNVSHPIKLTRLAMRKSLGRGKRASVCIIVSSFPFLLTIFFLCVASPQPLLCSQVFGMS